MYGLRSVGYRNTSLNYGGSLGGQNPETMWNNNVFRAKLLSLTDLSDRGIKPEIKNPVDDLLDKFQIGDWVKAMTKNKKVCQGLVSRIVKDSNGKGVRVFVKDLLDKEIKEVLPSTLEFIRREDGVRADLQQSDVTNSHKNLRSSHRSGRNQYTVSVEENNSSNKKLQHLLEFNQFCNDIYKK